MTTSKFIIVTENAPDDYCVGWTYRSEPDRHFDTKDAALQFVARQAAEDHASVLVIDAQQEVEL